MGSDHLAANSAIRILLVDDHPAVRQGLALLLCSEEILVCAEAGGCAEGLKRAAETGPDLAMVDLSLDGEDGLDLIAEFHRRNLPVLVYSMHNDLRRIKDAFSAGALGYVNKREFHGVLIQAIREVARRRKFVSPAAASTLADGGSEAGRTEAILKLSHQEREVYQMLGEGSDTLEIADALGISTHTVESYYSRMLTKLNLKGMHELRRQAIDHQQRHER